MAARRWRLVGIWVGAAVLFGGALAAAQVGQDPLDDPDPAYQRPGMLDVAGEPFPAAAFGEDTPASGVRTVVFFTRPPLLPALRDALAGRPSLGRQARLAIVVAGAAEPPAGPVPAIADPNNLVARAYRMRVPRDGGPPVGYAIVDTRGQVRYHTLDPKTAQLLDEVETMLSATP